MNEQGASIHEKRDKELYSTSRGIIRGLTGRKRTITNGECLLKKVECFSSNAGKITNKIKAQVIFELKDEYEVVDLVEVADIPRSTYYYWEVRLSQPDKYEKSRNTVFVMHFLR